MGVLAELERIKREKSCLEHIITLVCLSRGKAEAAEMIYTLTTMLTDEGNARYELARMVVTSGERPSRWPGLERRPVQRFDLGTAPESSD